MSIPSLNDLSIGLRSLFYMVTNEELENDADVISKAIPWFFVFIILEFLVGRFRGHHTYRLNDGITSLTLGTVSEQAKLWGKTIIFLVYQKLHEKFGLVTFKNDHSFIAFLFAMMSVDFFYYWFHRFCHEFHFAFGAHSVHHSGEDYNLATALRQGAYQYVLGACSTLPLAIIIPPKALFAHFFVNTTSQFWFHTSQIGSLGIFEYFLNTPSAHRMHHRPPGNCNYGGVLIIFDKIFGTYVHETEHLDYYGLAKQYDTFDPVRANVEHLSRVMKNVDHGENRLLSLCKRRVKHRWVFDPLALFQPHPKTKTSLWKLPTKPYRPKLNPQIPYILNAYIIFLFLVQTLVFLLQSDLFKIKKLNIGTELFLRQIIFFFAASSIGRLFDGFERGRLLNSLRVAFSPIIIAFFVPNDSFLYYTSVIDSGLWFVVCMFLVGSHGKPVMKRIAETKEENLSQ